ncbi:hypothetical protein Vadar_012213 [Vaccinium darrowii]|uniref:Uncharacterized protein n=1 Tax=Vaccinium darrowii TaxID=229202 RepID=A0ACB7X043_9ERIC|nr:hypothetical protein Vadar_012213 [Vaccinium darrowii]
MHTLSVSCHKNTYTGSILIAVNPFTRLPHVYNVHMMEQYKGAPFGELSPNVFAVADASYRAMMMESRSQSILVSGESGAGKTETTKLIMQYLTYVDPNIIYLFWHGNDVGTQYRYGIYFYTPEQEKAALESKEQHQKLLNRTIVAEIRPTKKFYRAEEYHQQYLEKGGRFCFKQSADKGCNDPI